MKKLNKCRVCHHKTNYIGIGKLINHSIDYYECPRWKYVQTQYPYWLDEAYKNPINKSDTGIMLRNLANTSVVTSILFYLHKLNETVVDFAGGYGILVRLLRDVGINALWMDSYCPNLVSKGFEYTKGGAEVITAFEVFEHFIEPSTELEKLLKVAPCVKFSTLLTQSLRQDLMIAGTTAKNMGSI
jgi:hypothetical protein